MTVARTAVDLAPRRYQPFFDVLMAALTVAMLLAMYFDWGTNPESPWHGVIEGLLFTMIGLNWFVWPSGRAIRPFAIRLIGVVMFAIGLFGFMKSVSHHLI